jgi:large subunit ribosomal protein L24e
MYHPPRGLTFVLSNGDILYFCSSKCQKNHRMGRKPDNVNWIRKQDKEIEASEEAEEKE